MKKLISVRLEEEDYARLLEVAKPVGGVGKWITKKLNAPPIFVEQVPWKNLPKLPVDPPVLINKIKTYLCEKQDEQHVRL